MSLKVLVCNQLVSKFDCFSGLTVVVLKAEGKTLTLSDVLKIIATDSEMDLVVRWRTCIAPQKVQSSETDTGGK